VERDPASHRARPIFFGDAPTSVFPISWQDTGSGVFALATLVSVTGLGALRADTGRRVGMLSALGGNSALLVDSCVCGRNRATTHAPGFVALDVLGVNFRRRVRGGPLTPNRTPDGVQSSPGSGSRGCGAVPTCPPSLLSDQCQDHAATRSSTATLLVQRTRHVVCAVRCNRSLAGVQTYVVADANLPLSRSRSLRHREAYAKRSLKK